MSANACRSCVVVVLVGAVAHCAAADSVKPRAVLDEIDDSYANITAAFTRDSKSLASGGHPHTLKLWDVAAGKLISDWVSRAKPAPPSVGALAFSPDGKTLAVATAIGPKEVQLWDVAKPGLRWRLKVAGSGVASVLFAPDGKILASAGFDNGVRLLSPATGKSLRELKGRSGGVQEIAFAADGKTLYSGTEKGDVLEWEVSSGRLLRTLRGHEKPITSLGLSADSSLLLTGGRDAVLVRDLRTGKAKATIRDDCHLAVITRDGKHVLTAPGRSIGVWRVADGKEARRVRHAHPHAKALVLSPDGRTVAYVADNSQVVLWDVEKLVGEGK